MFGHTPEMFLGSYMLQKEAGVGGPAVEIGTFEGKSLLLLDAVMPAGRIIFGFDILNSSINKGQPDWEERNRRLRENLAKFATNRKRILLAARDSLRLTYAGVMEKVKAKPAIVHIDGNHTLPYVMHDLRLAENLIRDGGIVIVDDCFTPMWPDVTQAVCQYFNSLANTLAPFAYGFGKLYLCSITHHQLYSQNFEVIDQEAVKKEKTTMFGYQTNVFLPGNR